MIEQTIDLSVIDKDEYFIRPEHDPDFAALREEVDKVLEQINNCKEEAEELLGITVSLDDSKIGGYKFRVPRAVINLYVNSAYVFE